MLKIFGVELANKYTKMEQPAPKHFSPIGNYDSKKIILTDHCFTPPPKINKIN
jgi:hypothetical protein